MIYDHTAVLILALDTTTRTGSVAVMQGNTLLGVVTGDPTRTHGERLPAELQVVLRDAGVGRHDLQMLAVANGPGAFTGLRIGLAAIQGLAMVLEIPVVAVSALDALAEASTATEPGVQGEVTAWMDAERGEVFVARYPPPRNSETGWRPADRPIVAQPRQVLEAMPRHVASRALFIGDGAVRYRQDIDGHVGGTARVVEPPLALAPFVARLGLLRAACGEAGPPHALQPLYVRRSDAELERQRQHLA
jgi:tRNA threonylcarbamoyladenosine biosynthesis protein TsaB